MTYNYMVKSRLDNQELQIKEFNTLEECNAFISQDILVKIAELKPYESIHISVTRW